MQMGKASSFSKITDYIGKVSKEPLYVNGVLMYNAPERITVHKSIFYKDDCIQCGRCCSNFDTVWTKREMDEYASNPHLAQWYDKIKGALRHEIVDINGKTIEFVTTPRTPPKDSIVWSWKDKPDGERCRWIEGEPFSSLCGIHPIRSITCRMPHTRFFYSRKTNRTSIRTSQYGRNWALGCPIEFDPVMDIEGMEGVIREFKQLDDIANDIHVKTWLPDIIDYLESQIYGENSTYESAVLHTSAGKLISGG